MKHTKVNELDCYINISLQKR